MLPEILLVIGFALALFVIALGAYFLLSGAVPDVEDPQPLPKPVLVPAKPETAPPPDKGAVLRAIERLSQQLAAKPEPEPPARPILVKPVAVPSMPKPAPAGEKVKVRYLDVKGRILGEQTIDRLQRRPQLVYMYGKTKPKRGVFVCSHLHDGVWVYRQVGTER